MTKIKLTGNGARERWSAVHMAYKPVKERRIIRGLEPVYENGMATAYIDTRSGNIVVGVRGTKYVKDWIQANSLLPLGLLKYSPQYKEAKDVVDTVHARYPKKRIEVAGHSLGGAIATQLRRDYGDKVIDVAETWNPAVAPQDLIEGKPEKVVRNYHEYDPLRWLGGKWIETKVKYDPAWGKDAHGLHQFQPGGDGGGGDRQDVGGGKFAMTSRKRVR